MSSDGNRQIIRALYNRVRGAAPENHGGNAMHSQMRVRIKIMLPGPHTPGKTEMFLFAFLQQTAPAGQR